MDKQSAHFDHYVLCHHCDLLCRLPELAKQQKAVCPRCQTRLARNCHQMKRNILIYASSALVMLLLACSFLFISIRVIGVVNNIGVLQIPIILYDDNYWALMLIFLLFTLCFPAINLLIQILLCAKTRLSKRAKRRLLILYNQLTHWCMPEIFMAGVLVSFVKLTNYGDIGLSKAFLPFCLFIWFYLKSTIDFSQYRIWNELASNNFAKLPLKEGKTGISQNIRLCFQCHAILPAGQTHCPRCKQSGKLRQRLNIQWTMALLLTSFILYIPANVYGIMQTLFLGSSSTSTIIDGVVYMWQEGDYPVAFVIFVASIVIPVLKIIALSWLCYFVLVIKRKNKQDCLKVSRLYKIVEFIGRWSMIDIFVVAVVSSLIQHGEVISVYPDIGALFFAAVVIITMIASHKFDPRFIWDQRRYIEKSKYPLH